MVRRSDGAAAPVRRDQVDVGRPVLGRLVEHGRLGGGVARGDDRLADLARRVVVLGPQPRRQAMDEQAVGAGLLDAGQELGQRRALDGVAPVGEQRDLQVRELRADAGDESQHRVGVDAVGQRPARRLADHRPVAGGVRERDRQLQAVDLGRVEHQHELPEEVQRRVPGVEEQRKAGATRQRLAEERHRGLPRPHGPVSADPLDQPHRLAARHRLLGELQGACPILR